MREPSEYVGRRPTVATGYSIPQFNVIQWIGIAVQYKTITNNYLALKRREDEETARIELISPTTRSYESLLTCLTRIISPLLSAAFGGRRTGSAVSPVQQPPHEQDRHDVHSLFRSNHCRNTARHVLLECKGG